MDSKKAFGSMTKEESAEIISRAEFVHEMKAKALMHRQLLAAQCAIVAPRIVDYDGRAMTNFNVASEALAIADEIIRQSERNKTP